MTAHPAWPQSQYDQTGRDCRPACGAAPAEAVTRRRQESGGPVGAVKKNQEGTPNMHFEAKKVAVDVVNHGGSAVIVGRSKARVMAHVNNDWTIVSL